MKEFDKRKIHISNKLHMIYIASNNVRHSVTRPSLHFTQLHFPQLHYTCRHYSFSHLNFTQLHFTTLSFGLTPFKFPTSPIHLTLLHFTSLHCTFRCIPPHFYSFRFIPFIIAVLNLCLNILGLIVKVLNFSAGRWFQFLMVLFTKEYLPITFLCFLSLIFPT